MSNTDILIRNMIYLRKKNNMNQEDMAKMLGTNRSVIGSYEQKIASPSISTVITLSEKFDVDVDKLLFVDLEAYKFDLKDESKIFRVKEDNHYIEINYEYVRLTKKLVDAYDKIEELREQLNKVKC